jgi:hypothetical protein
MSGGELSSHRKKKKGHPLDWCVEQGWEWEQIVAEIGLDTEILGGCSIWDPACGYGHSLSRLQGLGFKGELIGSDLVDNLARADFDVQPKFFSANFVELTERPTDKPLSIWMNSPFSYGRKPWLEWFCRRALALATHRVVAIAPIKWLAGGKGRGPFFRVEFPPQQVLYFTQRPSMPPGDVIHLMKTPYEKGQIDYCAVVWDVRNPTKPGETRSVWLPRLGEQG